MRAEKERYFQGRTVRVYRLKEKKKKKKRRARVYREENRTNQAMKTGNCSRTGRGYKKKSAQNAHDHDQEVRQYLY